MQAERGQQDTATWYGMPDTLAGYEVVTDEAGNMHVNSLDGRVWDIVPEIVVSVYPDGFAGDYEYLAGGSRPYAKSLDEAIAMCPDGLSFGEINLSGTRQADDGTAGYAITERYSVMCNRRRVKGRFICLMYARNAVVRLIGTDFGY